MRCRSKRLTCTRPASAPSSSPPRRTLARRRGSLSPDEAWRAAERGEVRLLDLRTHRERRRHGAPPGAVAVSLVRHILRPAGPEAVYFCAAAGRSKLTLRRGAAEVAGGFRAWSAAGLPVATLADAAPGR